MTFQQSTWMHAGVLALLMALCTVTFRFFRRGDFSISFGVAYLIFILIAACLYFSSKKDAMSEMYWLIPALVTIPVSFLLLIVMPVGTEGMAIMLAVLGTVQFWAIGSLIDWLIQKRKRVRTTGSGLSP